MSGNGPTVIEEIDINIKSHSVTFLNSLRKSQINPPIPDATNKIYDNNKTIFYSLKIKPTRLLT